MVVGVVVCELHLPGARSLKDKRRVVKALIERIHRRYRVSIAETGYHDLHQRAQFAVAVVSNGEAELENLLESLRRMVEGEAEAILLQWHQQLMESVP